MWLCQDGRGAKNPKSEARNPKQAQNSNEEISKEPGGYTFEFSAFSVFEIVSDFVLRISDFEPLLGLTSG
ncbi:MAG TPA: hypothetical protein VFC78_08170 [Tepidisphaeraceae bacterium]|nr:hypothetical protein [Tepidisphaeraceae bacterium]